MKLTRRLKAASLLLLPAALGFANSPAAQNDEHWSQWRGPGAKGSMAQGTYPVKFDATNNVRWKAALPGKGCSTPVLWEKRIFLTAPVDGQDAALAFDWDGKALWQTTLGQGKSGKRGNSSGCNSSPATDGQRVFVYFKSGTLAALDLAGKVLWQTNLVAAFGAESLFWDQGTSPVLTRDSVVVARMHNGESWVAAFDQKAGQIRWKIPRNYETPVEGDNSYTTPLLLEQQGQETLLVYGAEHLTAYAAADGQLLWSCGDFNPRAMGYWPTIASPVLAGDVVIVGSGRADRDQPHLHGIKLGGKGDVTSSHRLWNRDDIGAFVPTPAVYEGKVYVLRDRGDIDCIDPLTGKSLWHEVLPKGKVNYYASPLIAAGKLYATREDGVIFVVPITGKFEILSENRMGEMVIASPVPYANRLLIRGERHLFCVGQE